MRFVALFVLALAATALAEEVKDDYNENEKQFEEENGILETKSEEQVEKDLLPKAEDEINEQNKEYEEGKKTFYEKLNELSDLPEKDIEHMKEGAIDDKKVNERFGRVRGIIETPEELRSSPESDAMLKAVYDKMSRVALPRSLDSNANGHVTAPKNQGSCGSCAAFGATSLHETCMLRAGATFAGLDLSEQHIIDCGYDHDSMNGCDGAHVNAYQRFFKNQGGTGMHEAAYPYLDRNPHLACPTTSHWNSGASVTDVAWDYSCNQQKMIQLLNEYGAVSAAIYASDSHFQNYAGGVFSGCSSRTINHAVTVVGYGTENGVDFWLVKNSWGPHWGAGGFIKIRRGTNECGIEDRCVVASCALTGSHDTAPTTVAPTLPPPSMSCNISTLFGTSTLTGSYTLRVRRNGVLYESSVTCANSICSPSNPGPSNACVYICGNTTC